MGLLQILGYPLLAVSLLEMLLGIALLRRGHGVSARVRRTAAVFVFAVAAYAFCASLTYAAADRGLDLDPIYRLAWIGWLTIPAGLHLLHALSGERSRRARSTVIALYLQWSLVFVLTLVTDWIELEPYSLLPYVDRVAPLEKPLRFLGSLQAFYVIALIVRLQRRSKGRERLQLSYFLLGMLIYAVGAAFTAALQPLLSSPPVDPSLASWFAAPSVLLMFVAVTRHRLFGIATLLSRALAVVVQLTLFGVVQLALFSALGQALRPTAAVAASFAFTATLLVATPLRRLLQTSVDAVLRRQGHTHRTLLREAAHAVVTILDPDELVAHLTNVVSRGLGAVSVAIYVADEDDAVVHLRHSQGGPPGGFPERLEGPALEELRRADGPLDLEARAAAAPARSGAPWRTPVPFEGFIGVPLECQDRLQGVILLDGRSDGAPYVEEDYEVLETLGYQAAVALANARLFHEATTDDLTGLHHRKYFLRRVEEEQERARLADRSVAVLMLDVDRFKRVNDTFGHANGDRVLQGIAWTLLRALRHPDIAARYGGEEFAVLLCDVDPSSARSVAERIREAVEAERYAGGTAVTVSIGLAVHSPAKERLSSTDLVGAADKALYDAKRSGRNRVCVGRLEREEGWSSSNTTPVAATPFDPTASGADLHI